MLISLLGLPRIDPLRVAVSLGMLMVALVLSLVGALRLVDALQLAFLTLVHPALAALLTGLAALGGALILVAAARSYLRYRRRSRPDTAAAAAAGAEVVAQLFDIVRKNPGRAAAVAAALGFLVGSNPKARKTLNEALGGAGDAGKPRAKSPGRGA